MSLPSHALPSHALPSRALLLIHDYSRPMTRPDWRKSKPIISTYRLYLKVQYFYKSELKKSKQLLYRTILRSIYNTDWYCVFYYIRYDVASPEARDFLDTTRLINMEGIEEALYSQDHT
jgi:hypothetical protein